MKLTAPQRELLAASCKPEGARRNSRALPSIERLQRAGLVTAECEVQPDALRGRHTLAYTVHATTAGRAALGVAGTHPGEGWVGVCSLDQNGEARCSKQCGVCSDGVAPSQAPGCEHPADRVSCTPAGEHHCDVCGANWHTPGAPQVAATAMRLQRRGGPKKMTFHAPSDSPLWDLPAGQRVSLFLSAAGVGAGQAEQEKEGRD